MSGTRTFHRPDQTVLSVERAAAIVAAEFPALAPIRAAYLGEGCDSVAFVVNGKLVFRFPKRADVADQLLREVELLPDVQRHVPVPIPVYSHVGRPSERFPHPFGAYSMLPGVPAIQWEPASLPLEATATALAGVLSGLHRWDRTDAARLGIPPLDIDDLIEEVRADALDDFAFLTQLAPDRPLERWRTFVADAPEPSHGDRPASVIHADLAAEHVLFDRTTGTVTGIIDWSELAVGDPSIDFSGIFHWGGEPLIARVLRHYEGATPDAGMLARARYLAACRGVLDVRFGHDMQRPDYIRGGLRALELCVASS